MQWKGWINRGEPCQKVLFECWDGSISGGQWVGTSWYSTSLAVKKCFKAADALLSSVWSFGLKPLAMSS
jgi:hypothetical protein